MPRFIGLLRGVNVGGNMLKMDRLRAICAELGFQNVQTYVQSGNIVFDAKGAIARNSKQLQENLADVARLPIRVTLRTPADFRSIIADNPFLKQNVDRKSLHITFLDQPADAEGLNKLSAIPAGADQFADDGSVIYLCCPNGYGKTKLSNNAIERVLACTATTRNWNTVTTLLKMATDEPADTENRS